MESPLKPHLDGDSLTQIFPFQKYAQSSKPRVSCRYGRDRVPGKTNQLKHSCSLLQRNLSRSVRPDSRGQPGCGHFRGGSGRLQRVRLGSSLSHQGQLLSGHKASLPFPHFLRVSVPPVKDTATQEVIPETLCGSGKETWKEGEGFHVSYFCGRLESNSAGKSCQTGN